MAKSKKTTPAKKKTKASSAPAKISSKNVAPQPKFWQRYGIWLIDFLFLFLIVGFFVGLYFFYQNHFLPITSLHELNLSNLSLEQAQTLTADHAQIPPDLKIILNAKDSKIASNSSQLGLSYDLDATLTQALTNQQQLPFYQLIAKAFVPADITLKPALAYSDSALSNYIASLANRVDQVGKHGYLDLETQNKTSNLVVEPGQNEVVINQAATKQLLLDGIPQQNSFTAIITETDFALTPDQVASLSAQANSLIDKKITLTTNKIDNYYFDLTASELIPLLGPDSETKDQLFNDLISQIETAVARPPQEPELIINADKTKVEKFVPPLDGLALQKDSFVSLLMPAITDLTQSSDKKLTLNLPLTTAKPQKSLGQTNSLGINELIGFGESYYAHSIPGRVHNVALTASRINNVLVAPGEEYSFNKTLGDVSAATGFQPGYIIQGGRSVLSDGGGVCQVSTTLFRALLDSGLQVTKRLPHSYRVSYYELDNDPGFDATVYSGNIDLRFVNDTEHYILVTSEADNRELYMTVKIYGTDDGRYTKVTDYKKFNAIPAPATEFIPDPSLAPGQRKQIDWAVGGLQTNFTHTIYNADGSVRSQKQYPSTYRAWSAKYLVGPE